MNFDQLAPFYRTMEFLSAGGKLQRCRMEFLAEIPTPRHILLAGEGHGRFLPECVRRFPAARITVIDSSARMLEIARGTVTSRKVEFIHADLLEWDGPPATFDLIVTNFFLDCFDPDPLAIVVSKLGTLATPIAEWLLADFEIPPNGPARLRSRLIIGLLYLFFRITTGLQTRALVPPEEFLATGGFTRHHRRTHDWGLLKSEWWRREL